MKVSVVIPYRSDCPARERALEWAFLRWQTAFPAWEVIIEGDAAGEPWRKALALARGVRRASGNVLVVADADVWCDQVAKASQLVGRTFAWAVPHRDVRRLNRETTARVLAGYPVEELLDVVRGHRLEESAYRGRIGGGMLVLRRETWAACPMDPRFVGWGGEDEAWGMALLALYPETVRLGGSLWHLWHPPAARKSRGLGSNANEQLRWEYVAARKRPEAMRQLVATVARDLQLHEAGGTGEAG